VKPLRDWSVRYKVSQAFVGNAIALRPTMTDGVLGVFFRHRRIATIGVKQRERI
jgi:hypothetical protein